MDRVSEFFGFRERRVHRKRCIGYSFQKSCLRISTGIRSALESFGDDICKKTKNREKHHTIGEDEVTTWFSPQDKTTQYGVSRLIDRARSEINAAIFFLTSKYIAADLDLIAAHRRGVKVRVITDATAAKNEYTKQELLREVEIPVKVESWGGKMHAKAMSVDGEFLVAGSMNWTTAGESTNDENSLLIRSARLASQFDEYYQHLWTSIPEKWMLPGSRPDPESLDSGNSCDDGVDNDFDDLADERDPGCSHNPPPLLKLPPHCWYPLSHWNFFRRIFGSPYRSSAHQMADGITARILATSDLHSASSVLLIPVAAGVADLDLSICEPRHKDVFFHPLALYHHLFFPSVV